MPMQISGVTIQGGMNILPRAGAPSPSPTPGPAPGPSDPDFSNVVFMFDGDGTDGEANNTFTDSSTNGFTVTETGSVVQGSFSPYGDNWSWYTKNSAIAFSTFSTTGDYTAEAWVSVNGIDNSGYCNIFYGGNNTQLSIGPLGGLGTVLDSQGVISRNYSADTNDGSWHHVAWCRSGTTNRVFLDGNLVGSGTSSNTIKIQQISGYSSGYEHDGFISNARVTNTALYTANFTPPTEPLTEVTGTHILTAQSNRFVDNSSNQYSLTINRGTPKVTPFSPFKDDDARDITTDGGSGYFDGNSYIYATITSGIAITGSTNFCFETWIYPTNISAVASGLLQAGQSDGTFTFRINTDGTLRALSTNQSIILSTNATVNENEWQHVAVTRDSGTLRIFINGIQRASVSDTTDFADVSSSDSLIVGGRYYNSTYQDVFSGYISNSRFVVGSGVYTANFTPSTAPLTAVTNTELLLDFQDSAIYDYSGLNNIDTVGNAQIDTAIKKYGTGSVKFDGTGDYLDIPGSTELILGTGDFTIEGWYYANNFTNRGTFVDSRGSSSTSGITIGHEASSGEIRVYMTASSGTDIVVNSNNFSTSQWTHIAITRESGIVRLFVDGNLEDSATRTTNLSNNHDYRVGYGTYTGTSYSYFNGYIDDFRITKGIARYTANFTPPTAALPKF